MQMDIIIPPLGESISEVVIGTILKPSGSEVEPDEEILEIETDKVNQALLAPGKGRLELRVKEGDKVAVGTTIGSVEAIEGATKTSQPVKKTESPIQKVEEIKEKPKAAAVEASSARLGVEAFVESIKAPAKEPSKSKEAPAAATPSVTPSSRAEPTESRKRMSPLRLTIAKRLVEAKQQTAMLTTFGEVDMSAVQAAREKYQEKFQKVYGVKLGFMSFFVKAVVRGLMLTPHLNAYIDGEDIVQRHYYDIGIAVSTDRGLVVPVLKNCDKLSFKDIELSIADFGRRAKEGTLKLDELKGGGFTITNGGIFGSLLSTPILNPPQSGILGMHKIEKRPVVLEGDTIVVRPMMYVALSYDHRIVDGREAVGFLVQVKEILEDPARLVLEI